MENEPYSNPLAPPSSQFSQKHETSADRSQPLTNDDFRKLMMTPRVVSHNQSSVTSSIRASNFKKNFKAKPEPSENLKKKKKIYESIKKHDGDVLNELAKKYRDRAKERRDGGIDISQINDVIQNTAYHAVGPENFDMDATQRRKQIINESKYLGGDMEHTHLVKGLDYALLHKVKAEIQSQEELEYLKNLKEKEEAKKKEELEKKKQSGLGKVAEISFDDHDRYAIHSKQAENILKTVFNKTLPEKNEMFIQGRLAYQYDLVDEFPDSEAPTTIIRSKAECPNIDAFSSLSTNQIIMNKLIQIWSYIRLGVNKKSNKRKLETRSEDFTEKSSQTKHSTKSKEDDIYNDIGDYIPDIKSNKKSQKNETNLQPRKSYFDTKPSDQQKIINEQRNFKQQAIELAASVVGSIDTELIMANTKRTKFQQKPESYAECYPGYDDAVIDSEDENEISKGKGRFGKKEIFAGEIDQYHDDEGDSKNHSNRKSKRNNNHRDGTNKHRDDKAKLDREYQKINALINNKKQRGEKVGMSYMSSDNFKKL